MTGEGLDERNEITDVVDDVMAYDDITDRGLISHRWPVSENSRS